MLQLDGGVAVPNPAAPQPGGHDPGPIGGGSCPCFVANGNGTKNTRAVSHIALVCGVIFPGRFETPQPTIGTKGRRIRGALFYFASSRAAATMSASPGSTRNAAPASGV